MTDTAADPRPDLPGRPAPISDAVGRLAGGAPPLAEMAAAAGLRRIHMIAWRDLDDPEAGGSEVHAAHAAASGILGRTGSGDAMVEIWNGMPFFSPLWSRCPSIVLLHHVHAEMWRMVLKPAALARVGELIEFRVAPPVYRRSRILTLSESSKAEIVELLGMHPENVDVVPPGISPRFHPGGTRSPHPLVISVGRLVPVKRFPLLVGALVALRARHPTLEAVIAGEGYERAALEAQIRAGGATSWLHLPGRVDDDDLLDLYQRAWVLSSTSLREGWGMTITEAGACGTPSVVTDIAGHHDAVSAGRSGLLVDVNGGDALVDALDNVIRDDGLRAALSAGAIEHAARFTWDMAARGTLDALCREARRRTRRAG